MCFFLISQKCISGEGGILLTLKRMLIVLRVYPVSCCLGMEYHHAGVAQCYCPDQFISWYNPVSFEGVITLYKNPDVSSYVEDEDETKVLINPRRFAEYDI